MIDQDKMRALAAKLRSMTKAYDVELPTAVEAADAIGLLLAEVEASQMDAKRYRHLREAPDDFDILYWGGAGWFTVSRESLDAFVDEDIEHSVGGK